MIYCCKSLIYGNIFCVVFLIFICIYRFFVVYLGTICTRI